jgi:hypothetical protein
MPTKKAMKNTPARQAKKCTKCAARKTFEKELTLSKIDIWEGLARDPNGLPMLGSKAACEPLPHNFEEYSAVEQVHIKAAFERGNARITKGLMWRHIAATFGVSVKVARGIGEMSLAQALLHTAEFGKCSFPRVLEFQTATDRRADAAPRQRRLSPHSFSVRS